MVIKKILTLLIATFVLWGCKKDLIPPELSSEMKYQENISRYLKAKLAEKDFLNIDLANSQISAYNNGDSNFLKIPFKSKSIKTDFIALQSDRIGICKIGTIVHFEIPDTPLPANRKITINSFGRDKKWEFDFTKTNRISTSGNNLLIHEVWPTLENVTVIGYYPKQGGGISQFAFDNILFLLNPGGATQMADGSYGVPPAGYLSGGFGDYGNYIHPTGAVQRMEFDRSYSKPGINITNLFKCFDQIADVGATWEISMNSDVPSTTFPNEPFNLKLSPGHSFITIKKIYGTSSVTKSFGFYPASGVSSITDPYGNVPSKINNDYQHEINSSITKSITKQQFDAVRSTTIANSYKHYCLATYNCTDFALSAWNSAFPSGPDKIVLPPFVAIFPAIVTPVQIVINNFPQMLYQNTKAFTNSDDPFPQGIFLGNKLAPNSPGECN